MTTMVAEIIRRQSNKILLLSVNFFEVAVACRFNRNLNLYLLCELLKITTHYSQITFSEESISGVYKRITINL